MKICMASEYLAKKEDAPLGGVEVRTINLAKILAKQGHEIHVLTSFIPGTQRFEKYDEVNIHRIGKKRLHTQRGDFLNRWEFNEALKINILEIKPDIIDASGFVSYAGSYKGAKKSKIPAVVTVHEVWQGEWIKNMGLVNGTLGHFLEKYYLNYNFDKYIAVSNFTAKKLKEKIRISPEKIAVIYNGINLDLFRSTKVNEKYSNPTIITVCRLVPYKHVDNLIKVTKKLKTDFPDIKLKIIGKGPEEEKLKNLANKLHISENIDFLGKIKEQEKFIRELKKSHVFSLPSSVEGFGFVVIEAMACGLPYVVSDIPPFREITKNGTGGYLVNSSDVEELSKKIKEALTDTKEESFEFIKENYSWKSAADKTVNLYEKMILDYR